MTTKLYNPKQMIDRFTSDRIREIARCTKLADFNPSVEGLFKLGHIVTIRM